MTIRRAAVTLASCALAIAVAPTAAQAAMGDGQREYRNYWWAATMADNDTWGYVSEVYFRGGGNDQPDGGLRECPRPGGRPLPA